MSSLADVNRDVSTAYCKGPFTQAIFVAQFDAIFVAPKLHKVARPVYTGDFCRATQCNFCRAKVASSFEHVLNLMQLHGDKNCIELRDKNRLCKRALSLHDVTSRFTSKVTAS